MIKNISYQNYGTAILLFLTGQNESDAYGKYLHVYNWNGTSSDPEYVADNIISCWSTKARLMKYLINRRIMELWGSKFKGVKGGCLGEARKLAKQDFDAINTDSYRSVNSNFETATFGTMSAEKPDSDFKDAVLSNAFAAKD
jgi:hypothetical protein